MQCELVKEKTSVGLILKGTKHFYNERISIRQTSEQGNGIAILDSIGVVHLEKCPARRDDLVDEAEKCFDWRRSAKSSGCRPSDRRQCSPSSRSELGATHGPSQRTHFAKFVLSSTINNSINIDAINNAL